MTGNNEFHLNGATMVEIRQEWLNSRTREMRKQFVKSVNEDKSNNVFVVKIMSEGE